MSEKKIADQREIMIRIDAKYGSSSCPAFREFLKLVWTCVIQVDCRNLCGIHFLAEDDAFNNLIEDIFKLVRRTFTWNVQVESLNNDRSILNWPGEMGNRTAQNKFGGHY